MCNFIRFIDHSIFSILQDNSFLLEHAKQIIPDNRHPGEPWYTPPMKILLLMHTYIVKTILMSPAFFFYYVSHDA